MRTAWTGALKTGERLWGAGMRSSPICPHCEDGARETVEHIWWECRAWSCVRNRHLGKYGEAELKELPACTRQCGIKPLTKDIDKEALKLKAEEEEEQFPPCREEGEVCDEKYVDGKLVVASDGACPDQQGDPRLRRSGQGLFYGDGHSYNCAWATNTYSQGAQRAEVRAAARWVAWAWGPTVLWTDSALVVRGVRRILDGKDHGMKAHKDLWGRIKA